MFAASAAYHSFMPLPDELPVARVRSVRTFASVASSCASAFVALGLHVGNGLRVARQLARWTWTFLMALVVLAYLVGRFLSWTSPPRDAAPAPPTVPPDLMQQLQGVEVIDRPAPNGSGTVKTLGRRPRPAALDESPGDEPASEPASEAPAAPPSTL
jgi:hypothetical protein